MGENSTGKTSILYLLKFLSDSEFWQRPSFNTKEIQLGSYSEIANQNSSKSYFRFGIFENDISSSGKHSRYRAVLITFKNENGLPNVSKFNYISDNYNVAAIIEEKKIQYIYKEVEIKQNKASNIRDFFRNWIVESDKDSGKEVYSSIEFETEFPKPLPLLALMRFVDTFVKRENKEGHSHIVKKTKGFTTESFLPSFFQKFCWIAPIRAKPEPTYSFHGMTRTSEGDHIPYLLLNLLKDDMVRSSIESFGIKGGLFESIDTFRFGEDSTSPFELDITLNNKKHKISNVGYGVSQILPFITEALLPEYAWYAIQQPEIHLHPRAQAALGDFIYKIHLSEHKIFAFETHSEYLIDRFRININKNQKAKINSQVLFFERTDNGNIVTPIEIDDKGRYSEYQPDAFTDFFINEEIELLEVS